MTNEWKIHEDQIWYCETIQDLKKSQITSEIIDFTSKKCWDTIDIKLEINPENNNFNIISVNIYRYSKEIYTKFISNQPITLEEQKLILWFLDNPETLKMAQRIFSNLKLLQWDKNKFLFDIYLKDSKWDFDITNFVSYLKYYIENYSLITRSDISDITHIREINWSNYYTYKCADWTKSIFIITDWKIVYLDKPLFKIQILDNWLIFWTQLNLHEQDWEESKEWIILEFDGKDFVQIYNKPWLESLFEVDIPVKWYSDLYKSKKHWKKWLIEFSKVNEWKESTQVREIFEAENDDIICNRSWFITTTNIEQILDWEEDIYRHTTYAKTDNYKWPPELLPMPVWQRESLNETDLLNLKKKYTWPLLLKPVMSICEIVSSDKEFKLNYLWDNYFMSIMEDGSNIYKFNETNLSFRKIEWLQWIHTNKFMWYKNTDLDKDKLLNWEPTKIHYSNWNYQVVVFDKVSQTINPLIIIKVNNFNIDIEKDRIKINFLYKTLIFYYKDWKLYWLKKWFKCKNENEIKKTNFLWFSKEEISIENTYEKMQEYLEEIEWPIIID